MLEFETIEAAVLRPAKPPKNKSYVYPKFADKRTDQRPITKIDTGRTLNRACQYDWLHDSVFEGKAIDRVIDEAKKSSEITQGYYFVTLTVDREKSSFVEGEGVSIDKWWTNHKAQTKTGFAPHCCQMDLDQEGKIHMHLLVVARNAAEIQALRSFVRWWSGSHGIVDCRAIESQLGVLKCLQYIYRPKGWHGRLPNQPQFQKVSLNRNLGSVSPRSLPKVTEVRVVATQEVTRKVIAPPYVISGDRAYMIPAMRPIAYLKNLDDMRDPDIEDALVKISEKGPMAVLAAHVETILTCIEDSGWKQVVLNRMYDKGFLTSYLKVVYRGGYRRGVRFLRNHTMFINKRYAYEAIETLMTFGKTCGIQVTNSIGEIRVILDRDMAPIVGVRALSYDELRSRIDARNVA